MTRLDVHSPNALVAIRCPQHGAMKPRPASTPEQRYYGAWWQCELCAYTVLFPSAELRAANGQVRTWL